MEVGIIGLGRMGENMGVRLLRNGHTVFGMDLSEESRAHAKGQGIETTDSVANLAALFTGAPRIFWLMVPAGKITAAVVQEVAEVAKPGDIVVDGGNSNYKESLQNAEVLAARGMHFLDCGTSGGVWGLENGYCLMVGGPKEAFDLMEPVFKDLAPENGYAHVGPSGSGHFVKMIHNGIEYGLLEAYAEGFEMLHAAKEFDLDLHQITTLWNNGSVIRSWILELAERVYEHDQDFEGLEDDVADNGTGRWTVQESLDRAVPLPVISLALQMRFRSRQDQSYALRAIAALRNQFGGHAVVARVPEE
ncbi:MAG: decarboxylating 6-phosphogluconate dehydrogenase [Armatimonadaceae bacterium]